ncbi:S9 family peptidase, partial [bacterium]|nr:S9 family peptidase [bacterium]
EGRLSQLHVCELATGSVRRVVDAPLDLHAFSWSPAGRELVFAAKRRADMGRNLNQDLFVVGRDGGEPRALTTNPAADTSPIWLPDGRIAYLRTDEPLYEVDEAVIAIIDPALGDTRILDRKAVGFSEFIWQFWHADGQFYFAAFNRGCIDIFAAGRAQPLTRTAHDFWQVDFGGGRMVLGGQDMLTPSAVYEVSLLGTGTGRLEKIIDPNAAWYGDVKLFEPHPFATLVEGRTINGWYFLPEGWRRGDRAPTVLSIHGGPEWMYGGWWQHDFHILAEAGYAVLIANPTGSSGYGAEFRRAVRGDWQGAPARDLLGCVDWAVAGGWADPQRLAVTGGSYGGYMAAWLTTQTDRFKAASMDRMLSDLASFWGTTDEKWPPEWSCGGRPWEEQARDYYRDASPLHHAGSVTTPTLISHGLRDYRCLVGQAESWFSALQARGVPSRLLRFAEEGHGVRRTDNQILLARETLEWFDRYVRSATTTEE